MTHFEGATPGSRTPPGTTLITATRLRGLLDDEERIEALGKHGLRLIDPEAPNGGRPLIRIEIDEAVAEMEAKRAGKAS